jgi:hypothetical protein
MVKLCTGLQLLKLNQNLNRAMKNLHILAYIFILTMILQSGYGQISDCCSLKNQISYNPSLPGELFRPLVAIDNSTWFNKDWLTADILMENGEIVRNKEVKYSGMLDELIWNEPQSNTAIKLDKAAINSFHYLNYKGDTSIYFRRLRIKREMVADSSDIYGELIYSGKLSLFVLHTYFIERREVSAINGVYAENDIYAEVPVYYFKLQNNIITGMKKLTKKNLSVLAPEKKDEINTFFRKNNPGKDFDKNELISLAQFLNSVLY